MEDFKIGITKMDNLVLKNKGKKFYDMADKMSRVQDLRIPPSRRYSEAAWYSFQSYTYYLACGMWSNAADSLKLCATMHKALKMKNEAAYLHVKLAEVYLKCDITEAIVSYNLAIAIFEELDKKLMVATLERTVGNIHYTSKHWDDAHICFMKASEYYTEVQKYVASDLCIEKAAMCLVELEEYSQACSLYESVAEGCCLNNLRRFQSVDYLLYSIICLIGIPIQNNIQLIHDEQKLFDKASKTVIETEYKEKYSQILQVIEDYTYKDYLWKSSKEFLFLRNIITARIEYHLENFIRHLFWWNNVRPLPGWCIKLLHVMCIEIQTELDLRKKKIDTILLQQDKLQALEEEIIKLEKLGVHESQIEEIRQIYETEKIKQILHEQQLLIEADERSDDDDDDDEENEEENDDDENNSSNKEIEGKNDRYDESDDEGDEVVVGGPNDKNVAAAGTSTQNIKK